MRAHLQLGRAYLWYRSFHGEPPVTVCVTPKVWSDLVAEDKRIKRYKRVLGMKVVVTDEKIHGRSVDTTIIDELHDGYSDR